MDRTHFFHQAPDIPHRRGRSVLVPDWPFKQRLPTLLLCVRHEKLIRQRSFENNLRTSFDATLRPDTEDQRTVDTGISTTREESTPRSARDPFGHPRMDLDTRPSSKLIRRYNASGVGCDLLRKSLTLPDCRCCRFCPEGAEETSPGQARSVSAALGSGSPRMGVP